MADRDECPICYVRIGEDDRLVLGCGHWFCADCAKGWADASGVGPRTRRISACIACPMCRAQTRFATAVLSASAVPAMGGGRQSRRQVAAPPPLRGVGGEEVEHNDACEVCDQVGDLLCCDTCTLVYHVRCLDPPLKKVPDFWPCPECVQLKARQIVKEHRSHKRGMAQRATVSGRRGVDSRFSARGIWKAAIWSTALGKNCHIGSFGSSEDAARAYDGFKLAMKGGAGGRTGCNFPASDPQSAAEKAGAAAFVQVMQLAARKGGAAPAAPVAAKSGAAKQHGSVVRAPKRKASEAAAAGGSSAECLKPRDEAPRGSAVAGAKSSPAKSRKRAKLASNVFRGVSAQKGGVSYKAALWMPKTASRDGYNKVAGSYPTEEEAARAYDSLRVSEFGEAGRQGCNFPDDIDLKTAAVIAAAPAPAGAAGASAAALAAASAAGTAAASAGPAASAAKSPARPKGPAIAHFAKCAKCAKCGSRAAKLDCAFTMCQQCCFEAHPGDCPAHAKAAGKKREEEELLALLYATAAPAAAQPPKPRVEHYEEALESVGDTVTLFCLADFLRSRHAEEALEKSRRRREEGAQAMEAARRRTANARGRAR